jgi:hypothetical protein
MDASAARPEWRRHPSSTGRRSVEGPVAAGAAPPYPGSVAPGGRTSTDAARPVPPCPSQAPTPLAAGPPHDDGSARTRRVRAASDHAWTKSGCQADGSQTAAVTPEAGVAAGVAPRRSARSWTGLRPGWADGRLGNSDTDLVGGKAVPHHCSGQHVRSGAGDATAPEPGLSYEPRSRRTLRAEIPPYPGQAPAPVRCRPGQGPFRRYCSANSCMSPGRFAQPGFNLLGHAR